MVWADGSISEGTASKNWQHRESEPSSIIKVTDYKADSSEERASPSPKAKGSSPNTLTWRRQRIL